MNVTWRRKLQLALFTHVQIFYTLDANFTSLNFYIFAPCYKNNYTHTYSMSKRNIVVGVNQHIGCVVYKHIRYIFLSFSGNPIIQYQTSIPSILDHVYNIKPECCKHRTHRTYRLLMVCHLAEFKIQ